MALYYVVALMETNNASNRRGIGYRSFWLCHSGPYQDLQACKLRSDELTGDFGVQWRGVRYYLKDSFPVREEELSAYGLARKRKEYQVLLPGLAGVE